MEYPNTNLSEKALHETIAYIESRLADIHDRGKCVFERALANSYHEMLVHYGRKLFILQSRRFLLSEPSAIVAECKTE